MAAGRAAKPGDGKQLERYWTKGAGALKIGWGTSGDFDRCVTHMAKFVHDPKALCSEYHHEATGMWPAQHAKQMRDGH